MSIPADIPDRTLPSSAQDHLNDHIALARAHNSLKGPFTLAFNTPSIDTGVVLWTPEVGERIIGLWVEFGEAFDVLGEQIGLGVAGTTDADLFGKFLVDSAPGTFPTFPGQRGVGYPPYAGTITLPSSAPIRARTVIGGNTEGSLDLYVIVLRP